MSAVSAVAVVSAVAENLRSPLWLVAAILDSSAILVHQVALINACV